MTYLFFILGTLFGMYYFEKEVKDFVGNDFSGYDTPPYFAAVVFTSILWILVVPIALIILLAKKLRERKNSGV